MACIIHEKEIQQYGNRLKSNAETKIKQYRLITCPSIYEKEIQQYGNRLKSKSKNKSAKVSIGIT